MKSSIPVNYSAFRKVAVHFRNPPSGSNGPVVVGLDRSARRPFTHYLWGKPRLKAAFASRFAAFWLVPALAGLCWTAKAQTATFDFDTGTPALTAGQNVPFDQTAGGITAHFSAASGGFSIQNYNTTFQTHSLFLDNYLYFNVQSSVLDILFNQPVTNISLAYVIGEATPVENPSPIGLTAYMDSAANPAIGTTNATGTYIGGEGQPSGLMTFSAGGQPFNLVRLALLAGGVGLGLMVDNITVSPTAVIAVPVLQSSWSADGPFIDNPSASVDATLKTISVPVSPADQFFRLRASTSTRVTRIQVGVSQVILNYE